MPFQSSFETRPLRVKWSDSVIIALIATGGVGPVKPFTDTQAVDISGSFTTPELSKTLFAGAGFNPTFNDAPASYTRDKKNLVGFGVDHSTDSVIDHPCHSEPGSVLTMSSALVVLPVLKNKIFTLNVDFSMSCTVSSFPDAAGATLGVIVTAFACLQAKSPAGGLIPMTIGAINEGDVCYPDSVTTCTLGNGWNILSQDFKTTQSAVSKTPELSGSVGFVVNINGPNSTVVAIP